MKHGYEQIKALAKSRRVPIPQMLALAPGNDPFYCGMPAQRTAGEWFAQMFERGGFGQGVHLRRVHYFLVSIEAAMPNGKPYENTIESWCFLANASKAARYLGLVDVAAFDDRRNPPPMVFEVERQAAGRYVTNDEIDLPSIDMPGLPAIELLRPSAEQRYALEIWCEKSTMNDVLVPICKRYSATLVTGLGELSVTVCQRLVERARRTDKPTRIIYISDFDPAGQSMPVAASRKIEFLAAGEDLDIRLQPIALTAAQITQYGLPRVPIKESERRRQRFEDTHGTGAVELDALEALHPGELKRIVEAELAPYFDRNLEHKVFTAYASAVREAEEITDEIHGQFAEEIAQAEHEWQAIGERLQQWREQYAPLWAQIAAELGEIDLDADYPKAEVDGDTEEALFDSLRDYTDQLDAYRAFRAGGWNA